jgi:hypothetical protein
MATLYTKKAHLAMRPKYGFALHAAYCIAISALIEMHVSSNILGIDTVIYAPPPTNPIVQDSATCANIAFFFCDPFSDLIVVAPAILFGTFN